MWLDSCDDVIFTFIVGSCSKTNPVQILFSYITHILEKACQLDESSLSKPYLKLESTFNIQASRTTGVVAELATVRAEAEENSVVIHEEKDGRINVE